jgi:EAL domain-containing protein (putative c-di-GMP-specific phosphodiesterase class I)
VALDDFGSDYSSLTYLMQLPVDFVKIDGSFARCIGETPRAQVIVEAIISLAHALGLEAVGEGIESAEQLEHFRRMGCDLVQGYYLDRPMPTEELGRLLETGTRPGLPNAPRGNGGPNGAKLPGSKTSPRFLFRFWSGG